MNLCTGCAVLSQIIKYCTKTTNFFCYIWISVNKSTVFILVLPASNLYIFNHLFIFHISLSRHKLKYLQLFILIMTWTWSTGTCQCPSQSRRLECSIMREGLRQIQCGSTCYCWCPLHLLLWYTYTGLNINVLIFTVTVYKHSKQNLTWQQKAVM